MDHERAHVLLYSFLLDWRSSNDHSQYVCLVGDEATSSIAYVYMTLDSTRILYSYWIQRRDCVLQEHQVSSMGFRWPNEYKVNGVIDTYQGY